MTLSDLASVGSFVSGFAVLVSLVFLYFQLRQITEQVKQAEKNQRAMITEAYVTRAGESLRWQASSPISELLTRAASGETNFTAEELHKIGMAVRYAILSFQDVYLHYNSGLIERSAYDASMGSMKDFWLAFPVFRVMSRSMATSPEIRAIIEGMMAEVPVSPKPDSRSFVEQFKSAVAAEAAKASS